MKILINIKTYITIIKNEADNAIKILIAILNINLIDVAFYS